MIERLVFAREKAIEKTHCYSADLLWNARFMITRFECLGLFIRARILLRAKKIALLLKYWSFIHRSRQKREEKGRTASVAYVT